MGEDDDEEDLSEAQLQAGLRAWAKEERRRRVKRPALPGLQAQPQQQQQQPQQQPQQQYAAEAVGDQQEEGTAEAATEEGEAAVGEGVVMVRAQRVVAAARSAERVSVRQAERAMLAQATHAALLGVFGVELIAGSEKSVGRPSRLLTWTTCMRRGCRWQQSAFFKHFRMQDRTTYVEGCFAAQNKWDLSPYPRLICGAGWGWARRRTTSSWATRTTSSGAVCTQR